jgi:hypothetical protein
MAGLYTEIGPFSANPRIIRFNGELLDENNSFAEEEVELSIVQW